MTNELTKQQAGIVLGLHKDGYYQHKIAAVFDVNPRAINQIINGDAYPNANPIKLPFAKEMMSKSKLGWFLKCKDFGKKKKES